MGPEGEVIHGAGGADGGGSGKQERTRVRERYGCKGKCSVRNRIILTSIGE